LSAVNVLVAAIILFGAIYILYYVRSDEKRLALIAAYTVSFALVMGLMTGARRGSRSSALALLMLLCWLSSSAATLARERSFKSG
jgi:hypothetical protein